MIGSPRPSIAILESKWAQRVRAELFSISGVVAFHTAEECGVEYVIGGVNSKDRPLIWVAFDESDQDDEISQGARVSEACVRSLGFCPDVLGQPLHALIKQLSVSHALLGPFTLCLSGLTSARLPIGEFRELAQLGSSVWLHFAIAEGWGEAVLGGASAADADTFLVQPSEAPEILNGFPSFYDSGAVPDEPKPLLGLLRGVVSSDELELVLRPAPGGATLLSSSNHEFGDPQRVAEVLLSRGRAIEAFEFLIRAECSVSETLANAAGREYSERGLFRRLWRVLSAASIGTRWQSDASMRWFFAAAASENEHVKVKDEISRYLAQHEAPELRALFSAAFPGPEFYEEASQALGAAETPTTLRVMAFAEMLQGSAQNAAVLLQRALRMSERIGDNSMVVASATDLSDLCSREGRYSDAVQWAEWAVDWYHRTGCRDELRLAVALALRGFNTMLFADDIPDRVLDIDVDMSRAGIPTTETLWSTAAEAAFVRGDFERAEELLRVALERSHLQQIPGVCADLVHVLRNAKNQGEANRVAAKAHAISKHSSGVQRALGRLAMGISLLDEDPEEASRYLDRALEQLCRAHEAPRIAQCAIYLALAHISCGNHEGAKLALKRGDRGLRELGLVGWTLLGGHEGRVHEARQLLQDQTRSLELKFLGGRTVQVNGGAQDLGLRQCEVLVALASSATGVTAEQLGVRVYGDAANLTTVKAIVSRLRQSVDVSSRPYSLVHAVSADFLELEGLVATGRLREAVGMYRGQLLPGSEAPIVIELREHLEELIRRAVVAARDVELLIVLSDALGGDLELLEAAITCLRPQDSRMSLVRAKHAKVMRDWQREG